MTFESVTWDAARASGLLAYVLLTGSVVVGIALSLGWRNAVWTRFVTNETHRYLSLLALVVTVLHGLTIAIDPFIEFAPLELLIPFASHYRPLWIALGITGAYLMGAVYASEWIRPRIGYAWWRRFHGLSFLVYALVTVHGLGTGSDTRTLWAILLYGASVVLVGTMLILRLLPDPPKVARPGLLALCGAALVGGVFWAWTGPLQPGWNAIANNGNGNGSLATPTPAP